MKTKNPIYQIKSIDGFQLEIIAHTNEYDFREIHRHNYNEIFLFEQGTGKHLIDFEYYPIKGPCLHLVAPGQPHRVERSLKSNGYVLKFTKEFYLADFLEKELPFMDFFTNKRYHSSHLKIDTSQCLYLQKILELIVLECSLKHPQKTAVQSLIKTFLVKIMYAYQEANPIQNTTKDLSVFEAFTSHLNQAFQKEQKVKFYATLLHITPEHLNHLCKQSSGKTAKELIIERVLLEAKRLLVSSSLEHKNIALQLGFIDVSNFYKFFKTHAKTSIKDFTAQYL